MKDVGWDYGCGLQLAEMIKVVNRYERKSSARQVFVKGRIAGVTVRMGLLLRPKPRFIIFHICEILTTGNRSVFGIRLRLARC